MAENIIDLNNPPKEPYTYQEFPKLMYHHTSGRILTVHTKEEQDKALSDGYKLEASPEFDYTQVNNWVAKRISKPKAADREEEKAEASADVPEEESGNRMKPFRKK